MSTQTVGQTPPQSHWDKPHFKKRDIGGALVLISIGILLLLNTTDIVGWGVWAYIFLSFLRLWPLYLLLAGLHIIFGKEGWARILMSIFSWLVFMIIIATALISYTNQSFSWDSIFTGLNINLNQNLQTQDTTVAKVDYPNVTSRDLNILLTAGKFSLTDSTATDFLTLHSVYPENQAVPNLAVSETNHKLSMAFTQDLSKSWLLFPVKGPEYNFGLGSSTLPTALTLEMTAGDGNITLEKTVVSDFNAKMTAGNLTVNLSNSALPEAISLEITAGNLDVILPKDIHLVVDYQLTAGSLSIGGQNLKWGTNTYIYNASETTKVSLNIQVTAGNLDINFK